MRMPETVGRQQIRASKYEAVFSSPGSWLSRNMKLDQFRTHQTWVSLSQEFPVADTVVPKFRPLVERTTMHLGSNRWKEENSFCSSENTGKEMNARIRGREG